jgi:hypothetical protein
MFLRRKAQSILEYAILLAIVIAAIIVMQTFMKRGIQGRLKDSSDRISGGESYSASDTTIFENRAMTTNRTIVEETGTSSTAPIQRIASTFGAPTIKGTGTDAISASAVSGGDTTSTTLAKTSGAANEAYRAAEYNAVSNASKDFAASETGDITTTLNEK